MSRLALYRKYRSASLDDVLGQDHIVATIKGAISKGNISHAYLFCGPRGVGKTSVARILARLVNQLNDDYEASNELDIIEIDAASNRGIDEIRNLREKIAIAPNRLKYKVYIIDEAHMLTREAFNALLKTLEEPPAHAIFILATTEAHKLPDTVVSRTQRFDFRPIGLMDLTGRLGTIAKAEKINITPDALSIIAQRGRGGFRDAIGLLDQLSATDNKIDAEFVGRMLGISPVEQLAVLVKSIVDGDLKSAIDEVEKMITQGNEPVMITRELAEYCRNVLLEQVSRSDSKSTSENIPASVLVRLIENLTSAQADFKITQHYSLPLELAVYKTAKSQQVSVSSGHAMSAPQQQKQNQSKLQVKPLEAKSTPRPDENSDNICLKGLSIIKQRNNSLYALMRSAEPTLAGDQIRLKCRFSFHKERIEEAKNRALIEAVMSKLASRPINLLCEVASASVVDQQHSQDDELVSSALEILGGEVV